VRLTPVTLAGLPRAGLRQTWYRCFPIAFARHQLSLGYSRAVISRFSGGRRLPAAELYELLYLAETRFVALCEFRALVGLPLAGLVVPFPRGAFRTKAFEVVLSKLVDLSDVVGIQNPLRTGAQELTGDWQGNHVRASLGPALPGITVPAPTELAATQELGLALHQAPELEGFLSISSVVPTRRILAVLPSKLLAGSAVRYRYGGQDFVLDRGGLRVQQL
jgi:hypothetical protein